MCHVRSVERKDGVLELKFGGIDLCGEKGVLDVKATVDTSMIAIDENFVVFLLVFCFG